MGATVRHTEAVQCCTGRQAMPDVNPGLWKTKVADLHNLQQLSLPSSLLYLGRVIIKMRDRVAASTSMGCKLQCLPEEQSLE